MECITLCNVFVCTLHLAWVHSLCHIRLFVTPWIVAHQAPRSMGFSRHEYWSGLPFPSPEDLPDQGSNPGVLLCRQILYHLSYREINRYMDK